MTKRDRVAGTHRVPGDKSITHRALMLAALGRGVSHIEGALTSLDARSTARVLRQLGATITPLRTAGGVTVRGRARFTQPRDTLHCGNSGTTARLLLGLLAGHPFRCRLTGDASLRRRPMRRVTEPLGAMGARVEDRGHDGLPLEISGGQLHPIDWPLSVPSAQIKSALLLAGVAGQVPVTIRGGEGSRDHTERMLRHLGYDVASRDEMLRFAPTGKLAAFDLSVPGDPSSAAFLIAASLLADDGELAITGVGLNPTRTGYFAIMAQMGATLAVETGADSFGEPVGTVVSQPSSLQAVDVASDAIPGIIDELPILACLAARATGTSRFRSVAELRVKESDRLALMVSNLRAVGVEAAAEGDDLVVQGTDAPLAGRVTTGGDHRIAMAFMVLGRQHGARIRVDDPDCAAVSFPGFAAALGRLSGGGQ
ncbi:MAG: 3-phosphoshikimate 1-carboxyvinyltransferase [Gemmatimonadota bacterium]